jgi:trigger factor
MQVSVETISGLRRRLTVGIPAAEIDPEVEKRIKDAARKVKVNGFRAGKVPAKVVKQRYGEGIRHEVLGEVINKHYYEAIVEQKLKPAGAPNIDTTKNTEGHDVEFTATFEVYPEVTLSDFSKFSIKKPAVEIKEQDVNDMIDKLRSQNATWQPVDRACAEKDQVNINYCGRKDGEEFAGGKAENQNLTLGSKSMIPGFEDGIVGMKKGDEKVIPLTFPEDYQNEELKGAAVEFTISVNEVSEQVLPELNEEFFKKYGVESSDEAVFRDEVKANMQRELQQARKTKIKNQVMDQLYGSQQFDLPSALIASETKRLREQMLSQFGQIPKNMDVNKLLPDEMFAEQAKRRVSLGLLINQVIESTPLAADEEKVKQAIQDLAASYAESDAVVQYYSTNREARANIEAMVLEEQVVDHILFNAKVEDEALSYEELIQQNAQRQ